MSVTISRVTRATAVAVLGTALVATAGNGIASAREVTSGGGTGGGTTACSPVTNLTARGDARTRDTGAASIKFSYTVKPCTQGQSVVIDARVAKTADPTAIAYNDPDAPSSDTVTVFGIAIRTSYLVTITVRDAASGSVVGTSSIYAGAVPKGV